MLIEEQALRRVIQAIIQATGSEAAEAVTVTDHLVRANLAGHDSHGVGMVPTYVDHFHKGSLKPNTAARLVTDSGAMLLYEGDRGYGQRVAMEAMAAAIQRCRDTGLTLLALRNAHHIGRVGTYGEMAIEAGLVSLHFVNVTDHDPLVAPYAGSDARFGTNPVCLAMPGTANTESVLLDMATSKVALGKIRVARNKGEQAPEGTLIDHHGQPTRDPNVMYEPPKGALRAFGDYKGYGMALFAEIFAGILTGGGTIQPENPRRDSIVNHMLTVVIDPARLVEREWLTAEFDALIRFAKDSPAADPAQPVLVAGDPERLAAARRRVEGLSIDDTTWGQIVAAAGRVGIDEAAVAALQAG